MSNQDSDTKLESEFRIFRQVAQVRVRSLDANLGSERLSPHHRWLAFLVRAPSIPTRFPLRPPPATHSGENCSTSILRVP
jgi:hypothetical protein